MIVTWLSPAFQFTSHLSSLLCSSSRHKEWPGVSGTAYLLRAMLFPSMERSLSILSPPWNWFPKWHLTQAASANSLGWASFFSSLLSKHDTWPRDPGSAATHGACLSRTLIVSLSPHPYCQAYTGFFSLHTTEQIAHRVCDQVKVNTPSTFLVHKLLRLFLWMQENTK